MRAAPAPVLTVFDLETSGAHRDADAVWLRLLSSGVRTHEYAAMLVKTYGFEAALEAALAYTPRLDERIDLRCRARSGFVAQDLLSLGFPPGEIARLAHADILPFASEPHALGWLYVTERATLHHAAVRRHLVAYRPELADACVYLAKATDGATVRWRELAAAIDQCGSSAHAAAQIVAGAHHASQSHRQWFLGDGQPAARS